jgi:putative addiction module component (TIGR02574 family)
VTRAAAAVLRDALDLSEAERVDLAAKLLASVDGPPDEVWDQAWADELEERLRAADRSGEHGASWSDVRARLLARGART